MKPSILLVELCLKIINPKLSISGSETMVGRAYQDVSIMDKDPEL